MKFFSKPHLIIKEKKSNIIQKTKHGQFSVYFLKSGWLSWLEYKALKFYFKKQIKGFSKKLFFRITPKFKNTKRSIGIRMGKGKGSLDQYYFLITKGQLFIEFAFQRKFKYYRESRKKLILEHLLKTVLVASTKTKLKMRLNRDLTKK